MVLPLDRAIVRSGSGSVSKLTWSEEEDSKLFNQALHHCTHQVTLLSLCSVCVCVGVCVRVWLCARERVCVCVCGLCSVCM